MIDSMSRFLRAVLSSVVSVVFSLSLLGALAGCSGGSGSGGAASTTTTTTSTPGPVVGSISPTQLAAGSAALTLTVNGSGFTSASQVQVGGTVETTIYVSSTQLTATVPAAQLANGATLNVVVTNGGTTSSATQLVVNNPAPVVVGSYQVIIGAPISSSTITFNGSGFVPSTVINVNGSPRATIYVSAMQVKAVLTAADVSISANLAITASNPAPAGGTSAPASLYVYSYASPIALYPNTLVLGSTTPTTVTVTGTNFNASTVVNIGNSARATTYVNSTTVTFTTTVADQATAGTLYVNVTNSLGATYGAYLTVAPPPSTPVITSVSPTSIVAGSGQTSLTVSGNNFTTSSVVQWNGTNLPTSYGYYYSYSTGTYSYQLLAIVPASDLTSVGTANVTVVTPNATPSNSNTVSVSITSPPVPTLTTLSPAGAAVGASTNVTLTGTGFTTNTTLAINGVTIPSTFVSSTQITATFPASALATPGNQNVTVTTPAPGGGTSAAQPFTTFIFISNNDIVYSPTDGLIYASIPAYALNGPGNSVVGIDPNTGNIARTIQVGTNPNKLAISTDGTQLFVGVDGAGAVAQINIAQGKVVNQFTLGTSSAGFSTQNTAEYMAAVPGLPNSVAVSTGAPYNTTGITIYDSGVSRSGNTVNTTAGPLSFGSSSATLYDGSSYVYALTVGANGITGSTTINPNSTSYYGNLLALQYDNGALYLSNGQVLNASTGALNGTFYTAGTTQANGPIVSDSTLGMAFVAGSSYSNINNSNGVYVFDESSFNQLGIIPVNGLGTNGYSTSFRKIVRWGQNGIAVSGVPSPFTTNNQIFILQSPLVKDVSSTPSDIGVSLMAPSVATTGAAISYVAKVTNNGPNAATGVTLSTGFDASLIINSATATQGSCTAGTVTRCDLGSLSNGASATVTINATHTVSGTFATTANVSSSSYDPIATNNQATASIAATGSLFSATPAITSLSPSLVQAGASAFTLTVNGSGFNSGSTVNFGSSALATTYVSATQLTASVTATQVTNYGWAAISVANPAPGGGSSAVLPLTIYDLVNLPVSSILFDPYSQSLFATLPSTATGITGNSVVAINPFTGTVGTPVAVGSQPTVMAESPDGNNIYISLSGADTLAQYDPVNQKLLQTISYTNKPTYYGTTASVATGLAVMPGADSTLAVNFNGIEGILDVTGNTGKFRTNLGTSSFPIFGDATHLYTSGGESYNSLYRYTVNASGLTLIDTDSLNGLGGTVSGFQQPGGLIYGNSGGIVNPNTTPASQIATLTPYDFYGADAVSGGVGVSADPSLQKEFLMLQNFAGTSEYGLVRYDLNTYLPEAVVSLPTPLSVVSGPMYRFGQDGLAFLSTSNSYSASGNPSQVVLLRGPFIAPQELTTQTAASLTSSSTSSLTHGSGNATLTLTGTNFLPGVAVTWNGSYRTTAIVDATHISVAIPASDLSTTGTASVVATNPGAAASNALALTIN